MSKGLGVIQCLIVEAMQTRHGVGNPHVLDSERAAVIGGDFVHKCGPGRRCGYGVYLAGGLHDMRQVKKELEARHSYKMIKYGSFNDQKWDAAFSRALRTLEKRGVIEFPSIVKLMIDDGGFAQHDLADGVYMDAHRTQRRFARLKDSA